MIHNGDGTRRAAPGGGPFNTARALARLGVPTAFLGRLSTDAFGRDLAGLLKEDGADLQFATIGPESTTIAVADVDSEGFAEYQFLIPGDEYRERLRTVISQSTIVKASDTDVAWLYPEVDYERAADLLLNEGARLAVVTLGADGAFGAHHDFRVRVAAPP